MIKIKTKKEDGEVTLRSGQSLGVGIKAAVDSGASAILVNCSWPESITRAMPILADCGLPYGGYANGFLAIEKLVPGGTVKDLTARTDLGPDAYADYAMAWVKAGAIIIGGCCEVGPSHISELKHQIESAGHKIVKAE